MSLRIDKKIDLLDFSTKTLEGILYIVPFNYLGEF